MDNGPEGAWISADKAKRGNSNRPSAAKFRRGNGELLVVAIGLSSVRADLDGVEWVGRVHLAEALSYRALADEVRRAA